MLETYTPYCRSNYPSLLEVDVRRLELTHERQNCSMERTRHPTLFRFVPANWRH